MLNQLKSISISTRVIVFTVAMMVLVVVANYVVFYKEYQSTAHAKMEQQAAQFTAVAEEAKRYASDLHEQGVYDRNELMEDLAEVKAAGKSHQESKIFKTLPIVVGWTAAQRAAEAEGVNFDVVATEARNKKNEPEKGTFEWQMYVDMVKQAEQQGEDDLLRVDESTNTLHFMRAIHLTEDCMSCHGNADPEINPAGLDVVGFPMEGWKVGQVHGAFHVEMPLAPVDAGVNQALLRAMMWTLPIMLLGIGLFVWAFRSVLTKPVNRMIEQIRVIQQTNDLTQRTDVVGNDEIGQVGQSVNGFVETLHGVVSQASQVSQELATASTEVAATAEEMARGMDEQRVQVTNVSANVEEMSATVMEVARQSSEANQTARADRSSNKPWTP